MSALQTLERLEGLAKAVGAQYVFDDKVWLFSAPEIAAFAARIRAEALEEAAQIADSLRDDREERRAHVASNMRDGNISDQLRSLKHHQTVTMWNTALRKTAAAIRNLSSASTPSATGVKQL